MNRTTSFPRCCQAAALSCSRSSAATASERVAVLDLNTAQVENGDSLRKPGGIRGDGSPRLRGRRGAVGRPLRCDDAGCRRRSGARCSSTSRGAHAAANLALSRHGMLAYAPSAGAGDARSLVWVDRHGNESPIAAPTRAYVLPRLSPDGTRVAVSIDDGQRPEFWIWDFSLQKLVAAAIRSRATRRVFWSGRLTAGISSSGRETSFGARRMAPAPWSNWPTTSMPDATRRRAVAISPDGRRLIFERADAGALVRPDGAPSRRPPTSKRRREIERRRSSTRRPTNGTRRLLPMAAGWRTNRTRRGSSRST